MIIKHQWADKISNC